MASNVITSTPVFRANWRTSANFREALAFGLPIITTRWRSLPEMLPPDYPGLIADQNPAVLAAVLRGME